MRQNSVSLRNPLRSSDITVSTRHDINYEHIQGPFAISRPRDQLGSARQVSATAHWNNTEKQNYSIFVFYFRQLLQETNWSKTNWNIFKGMSQFIKTRNPQQCRSHHLKLTKAFNNIRAYISTIVKRIPNLKQKIFQFQQRLTQIQNQLCLYSVPITSVRSQKHPQMQIEQAHLMRSCQTFAQGQGLYEKVQKQDFVKTADSYMDNQHPVNFDNNNFAFFNSQSEFKPFQYSKVKRSRLSLPLFADEHEDFHQSKQSHKHNKIMNRLTCSKSQNYEQEILNAQNVNKEFKQNTQKTQQQTKNMQSQTKNMQINEITHVMPLLISTFDEQTLKNNEVVFS